MSWTNITIDQLEELVKFYKSRRNSHDQIFSLEIESIPIKSSNYPLDIPELPKDIIHMIARYERVIYTADDLKWLIQLDPSKKLAKQCLKDQTGLDLDVDRVLAILSMSDDSDSPNVYRRFCSLMDFNLYNPNLVHPKIIDYALPRYDLIAGEYKRFIDNLNKLIDIAIDHKDFDIASKILDRVYINVIDDDDNNRHIRLSKTKGPLYWLDHGDKIQQQFIMNKMDSYITEDCDIEVLNNAGYTNEYLIKLALKLDDLGYTKEHLMSSLIDEIPDARLIDRYYLSSKDGIKNLLELRNHAPVLLTEIINNLDQHLDIKVKFISLISGLMDLTQYNIT